MKRIICFLLTVVLLCALMLPMASPAGAAGQKQNTNRTIAIVFDNSGSMYHLGESMDRWCRATYAMEVFASMLNAGDKLLIYPMWGINTDGSNNEVYTDTNPLLINGPEQAATVRKIFTPNPLGTPITTIDNAYSGLQGESGDKWLIVLTDGTSFHTGKNGPVMGKDETERALSDKLSGMSRDVNVLYLGIGADAAAPNISAQGMVSDVKLAADSAEVLSKLTEMCNLIFGRDTLPASHLQGKDMKLDVSISKLIVFVQGDNVSGLQVTAGAGTSIGTPKSSRDTKYSEKGSNEDELVDTSLQGMIVTYDGVAIGDYKIEFNGTADSIEVYYEPDVDMVFTFTDENGREVPPDQLYEGNYRITYGMMDGITGQYTESPLLGKTVYDGSYTINGVETPIHAEDKGGEVQVPLKEGDEFDCRMTVTYLSGYQITKEGSEFGLPTFVTPRPAGDFALQVSGGQTSYEINALESGAPFRVEAFYDGQKLTGDELKAVALDIDQSKSEAVLTPEYQDDHIDIHLSHKDPANPSATGTGSWTVPVTGRYKAQGADEATDTRQLQYDIVLSQPGELRLQLSGGQAAYELTTLEEGEPFRAEVFYGGDKLVGPDLEHVDIAWNPDDSGALLEKVFQDDHWDIVLSHKNPSDPEATPTGEFTVPLTAVYTAPASERAESAPVPLTYSIEDNRSPLRVKLKASQTYYVISQIEGSDPIRAEITSDGVPLTPEEFAKTTFEASCSGGLRLRQEPLPEESAYLLYLEKDPGLKADDYEITCQVSQVDEIGRTTTSRDKVAVTLSSIPLWLKWLIIGLSLLLLILIIAAILHIKALPTKLHVTKRDSNMNVDGEDETKNAAFAGELEKRRLDVHSKFGGKKFGIVMDVKPGKGSYLKTPQAKRSAEVNPASVKKLGNATITEATIGTVKYVFDEEKHRLERMPKSDKPFTVKHGARVAYSGVLMSNGEPKNFSVVTKLNFKKK